MGWFGASEPEQKKNYDDEIQGFNTVDKYDTGATMTASAPPPPQLAQMGGGGGMPQMGTRGFNTLFDRIKRGKRSTRRVLFGNSKSFQRLKLKIKEFSTC